MKVRTFAAMAALMVGGTVGAAAPMAGAAAKPKPCTNIATAVGKNGKPLKNSGKENGQKLFKGRPSAGPHDQERVIGATANVSGYTTTVLGTQVVPQIDDFQNDGYFKATVRICSRDDGPQRWSVSDWKLQTPSGNTVSPTIVVSVPTLDYAGGELATDGRVEGDIYFQVGNPAPPGTYYVLYEPDFLNETHGVWQVNI